MTRRLAAALATAVLLAGCGSADTTVRAPVFNAADVMFLQMMVPHHLQGIEIVRLAPDRATDPEVRMLAAAIETTQLSEVDAMAGWLRDWGQPTDADADAHAAHGGMPSTSAAEIAALASAADFDRQFLNLLIAHQDDAIQMARAEAAHGQNPAAKALAGRIDASRSAQLQQMLALLGTDQRQG